MDVPLEAVMTFRYDGRTVVKGEAFAARSAYDAQVLLLLQKAKHAPLSPDVIEPTPRRSHRRTAEIE